ncbi:MAG: thiolase family protein [Xanthobacteraceae bacterium]|nr:thiolase family protein [Xanthobacteraceae bacterium]
MGAWALKDKAAIAGVGTTGYGAFPETDDYGLGLEALRLAVDDAGIDFGEIDGLIINRIPNYERFVQLANLNPTYVLATEAHGRFSAVSLMLATQALASGSAKVVALVYGNNGRSARAKYGGSGMWAPWGFTSPGATHAMMFRQHMHEFSTKSEDLANISVAFRKHASMNPAAVMRAPITVEDHQNSRFVCDPLHLLDYCIINDGGVAWIVTTPDRAKDLKRRPVHVAGYAVQASFNHNAVPNSDYWYPALRKVASEVYPRADLDRSAVNGLMIYDNFSPTVLFSLEGMGFCEQGEGGAFVRSGTLELGRGRWPTNTSGGHLSESYMQGWGLIAEGVRQLRGECGARQIPNCNVIQYICATNICSSIILRK